MFDRRHGADRASASEDDNGYVETDPTRRYGRFNEVLGKGATKVVYRAFDELNGTEVAWNQAKLSHVLRSPEPLQRIYSEVHLLSTLDHGSIIQFHASWIDIHNRTFNFITELFSSGTLREYRQKYRRVNIRAVKNWASQILRGIVYLHGHDPPVIHRDLKCDNIFVNGHLGQVKIGDLGLAAVLQESQNAHSVIGTPEFMAPELYEEEYDQLVDIYSFGMCVLEMLTGEYPYSECSNPAQIYKKVTSGKLPDAFHRISDPEAKRFIGRCLQTASKRSTAKQLLSDPFLSSDDCRNLLRTSNGVSATIKTKDTRREDNHGSSIITRHTDMTITGKLNPDDDNIFLKVKIADKDAGRVRNIYFPFDIVTDTPIDVANEMVKELELTDREPSKIAEVISKEITLLVPGWKDREPADEGHHHEYNYGEDTGHPFNSIPSPTASNYSEFGAGSSPGEHYWPAAACQADWLPDDPFSNSDDASSVHSGKYSAVNYHFADEDNLRSRYESRRVGVALADEFKGQCSMLPPESPPQTFECRKGKKKLSRNQSMVDVRSQLVNRTLLEGLKRRLFKTVGAVENIGFRMPYDESRGKSPSSSPLRGECKKPESRGKSPSSSPLRGECKKPGFIRGRG